MNAIEMIRRCARHGGGPGLGLARDDAMPRHDTRECRQISDGARRGGATGPNLLVWNGRSHLLAVELKEDGCDPPPAGATSER